MHEPGRIRMAPHDDNGPLALIDQDGVGGLEILHEGQFRPVAPCQGALVVNLGCVFHMWTRGLYQSNVHRVVTAGGEGASSPDRLSAVFYYNPDLNTPISPLPSPHLVDRPRIKEEEGEERLVYRDIIFRRMEQRRGDRPPPTMAGHHPLS